MISNIKGKSLEWFFTAAALSLLVASAAKLYSTAGTAKILGASDLYLRLNNRWLMESVGLLEAVIAVYLLRGRDYGMRAVALFWLSSNLMFYRVANYLLGITSCPCLGTLGQKLPLSQAHLDMILTVLVLSWFLGSCYVIWGGGNPKPEGMPGDVLEGHDAVQT